MNPKIGRVLFPALLMISFFSLWAAFALLIINPLFYEDLPGYTIGRICVWEYVAMGVAVLIAKMLISKWGNIEFQEIGRKKVIILNANYGIYFALYFLTAILLGIWQFWIFSQRF